MYELYFRSVVDNPVCRTCPELQELLHISATSFDERQASRGPRCNGLIIEYFRQCVNTLPGPTGKIDMC